MTSFHIFHTSRLRRCLLAAAVVQALIALPVVAQTASDIQNPPEKGRADTKKSVTLKEVVVTAQRRKENIQKVPIAVTALDEVELNARDIRNVSDLGAVAPTLTVMKVIGSGGTSATIAMRGAATVNPDPYMNFPVALYVDGVFMGNTRGDVFDLVNLERIEVLRGPQGTLFGRNTMAGAINLITRQPSGQFTGDASLSLGNYGSKVAKATVDLPAMGKLKVSLGGRVERRAGWVNTTPGSTPPELDNRHNQEAYVGLEYDATDNLTFNYKFDYTKINERSGFDQAIHSDVEQVFGIPGIIVKPGRQSTASVDSRSYEASEIVGHALIANWKLGDAGAFKYIGSYRDVHWSDGMDLDGSPILFAQSENLQRKHQLSHELQYLGSYGRWNWVAGLYYFEEHGHVNVPQVYFLGAIVYDQNNYSFDTRARAAYGQVDYKLTDRLTLTAGWRRSLEERKLARFASRLNPPTVVIPQTHAQKGFGATTPTVSLAYQVTANNMVYARYAEGFLSGGFNGGSTSVATSVLPYLQQTAKTYEIGTKNILLDGRLSLNADIFYNRTSNLQQAVFTANLGLGSAILNVGSSHQEGFEMDAKLRATKNFTLGLNYGYLKSRYDKYMDRGVNVADNRAVQFAPRNTATVVLDDVLAHTSNGVLHATLDYRYTSKFYMYVYPFTQITPPSQLAANTLIRSYGVINGRIAFSEMDWGHGIQGEVALWVKNLSNKEHIDSIIDFGPSFANLRVANYNAPRMFGVTVTARW